MSGNPIDITATIVGGVQVSTRFLLAGSRVRAHVEREINRLSIRLQRKVKEEKLSGQVLKVQTGRLKRSINRRTGRDGDLFFARVGTNVEYGRTWELFGTPAMDIYPRSAKALRWFGASGEPIFAARVHKPAVPAKPFLRPSLEEMRPEIQMRLARAAFMGIA